MRNQAVHPDVEDSMSNFRVLVSLFAAIALSTRSFATEVQLPPVMKDLAHVWIGDTCDKQETYRLQLDVRGKGTLVILGWLPQTYRITRTRLSKFEVTFDAVPVDSAESISVSGTAYGLLKLVVKPTSGSWKQEVTLMPYENFMRRVHDINISAAEISKRK